PYCSRNGLGGGAASSARRGQGAWRSAQHTARSERRTAAGAAARPGPGRGSDARSIDIPTARAPNEVPFPGTVTYPEHVTGRSAGGLLQKSMKGADWRGLGDRGARIGRQPYRKWTKCVPMALSSISERAVWLHSDLTFALRCGGGWHWVICMSSGLQLSDACFRCLPT